MRLGARAVVLGGSVAGLCAAGAVAGYFDEVVVVERDVLPDAAAHRRGVPQSRHPHFLLNSGRRAIEAIFPGYEKDLIAAGGRVLMPSMAAAHCEGPGWIPRTESSLNMLYGSRVLIESVVRDRVRALTNVSVLSATAVRDIETERGGRPGGRVTGAWIADDQVPGGQRLIEADLVIDAMGRGSSVADWLRAAGWPEVPVRTLDAGVTYVSRWYEKPGHLPADWWWDQLSLMPTTSRAPHPPEQDFLCQIFLVERDQVIVTMGSWGLDMPRKNDDFIAAAERTRAPAFATAVHRCAPLTDVFLTHSTGNKWRRYDELDDPPAGLVPVGDSVCAFNPLYGQGMSSAARSAVLLAEHLAAASSTGGDFVEGFLSAQRASLGVPWSLALARDQGYPHATGTEIAPRWRQWLIGRYSWSVFQHISAASREDMAVEGHFTRVFNLDESIAEMTRSPRFLFGLARFALLRLLRRTRLPLGFDERADPPARVYAR